MTLSFLPLSPLSMSRCVLEKSLVVAAVVAGSRKGQIQNAEPRYSLAAQSSRYRTLLMNEYERVCIPDTQGGSVLYSCRNVCSLRRREIVILNCCSLSVVLKTPALVIFGLFNWMQPSICLNNWNIQSSEFRNRQFTRWTLKWNLNSAQSFTFCHKT